MRDLINTPRKNIYLNGYSGFIIIHILLKGQCENRAIYC